MKLDWDRPQGEAWQRYERTVMGTALFFRNGAPLAFKWLGWCALLALIRYVEQRTGMWPATALKWILGILLWGYFMELISPGKPEWLPKEQFLSKSTLRRMLISIAATAGMVGASYWFADAFMKNPL